MMLQIRKLESTPQDNYEWHALEYVNFRRDGAPKSTLRRITSIRAFAKWAWGMEVLSDYIAPKPAPTVPHPLKGGMEDVWKMYETAASISVKRLIVLQGFFALRVSEAREVIPTHFDQVNFELTVRGKGDKIRNLPYSLITYGLLGDLNLTENTLVNMNDSGARNAIHATAKQSGIGYDVSSHDLRATCLTDLYERTKDIRLVAEFAGHANINQTMVYIRTNRNAMREAVSFVRP